MTYELTDSNGKVLIRSNINRYTGKTQSLTIGGAEQHCYERQCINKRYFKTVTGDGI